MLSDVRVSALFNGRSATKGPKDPRSEFERDYGRLLFAAPVRRLSAKAQVFPLEPNDFVRTRLTHSLEVSNVARDLTWQVGQRLIDKHRESISLNDVAQMAVISATCGLIHDLGNPPFGHAGELAISTWFRDRSKTDTTIKAFADQHPKLACDFSSFEGNAQTLRIITRLQPPVNAHSLDLTCGILSAAGKYLSAACEADGSRGHEFSKPGFFQSESELVSKVREQTETAGVRNPITYLVEAADDIVYCTVDIEDSVRKGVVTWTEVERQLGGDVHGAELFQAAIMRTRQIAGTSAPSSKAEQQEFATAFRTAALGEMVPAVIETFLERYGEIMQGSYRDELVNDKSCRARQLISAAKQLLRRTVYRSPAVLGLEILGRRVIHELLDLFWEGCSGNEFPRQDVKTYGRKIYQLLSANYRAVCERRLQDQQEDPSYIRIQLAVDQIAGMTDTFACSLYRQVTQPPL